jgi:threonine aldolase
VRDRSFASDNAVGAHPAVLAALADANAGALGSYGDDPHTAAAVAGIRRLLGDHVEVRLVTTGTAANVLGLASVLRAHEAVIAPASAHLVTDESTAPGTHGVHVIAVPTADGRLRPGDVDALAGTIGNPHAPQPRVVSMTQSSELGLVSTPAETRALADAAHRHGLLLHMDGARLANAAAALGLPPRALVTDAGVDLLALGFTKAGALGAEAIVGLAPGVLDGIDMTLKRGMQLVSKGRALGAQVAALLQDDRWLQGAAHANALAARLADGLARVPGVTLARPAQANAVFAILPPAVEAALAARYVFYPWNPATREFRLMCSWATTAPAVDALVALATGAAVR